MSWAHQQPVIFSDEDELQLKLQFAHMCAEDPANCELHGYTLFPGEANYGRAMAAQKWLSDPFVQGEITRLKSESVSLAEMLPEKERWIKEGWDRSRSEPNAEIRFKYWLETGKALGYAGNAGDNNVNINVIQNVIEVPTRATEAELPALEGQWAEQQRNLIADARSNRPA